MSEKTKTAKSAKKPIAKKENLGVLLRQIGGDVKQMRGDIKRMDGSIGQINSDIKRMDGSIDRLIDGHIELNQKIDAIGADLNEFKVETHEGFINVWREIGSMKDEMGLMKKEMNANFDELFDFRDETNANFSQVLKCLSAIEDELADIKAELKRLDGTKAEKREFLSLENRVAKLEQGLLDCKILIKGGK